MNPNPDTSGLKKWKPGQSGNPTGKAGKDYITRHLRARPDADWEKLANKLWAMALAGNMVAAHEIYDRVEGKVPQPTAVEGGLEIVVRRVDRNSNDG